MPDTLTARDRYHLKKYGSVDSPVRLAMKNGGMVSEHRDTLLKQFGNGVKDITANNEFSFVPESYTTTNPKTVYPQQIQNSGIIPTIQHNVSAIYNNLFNKPEPNSIKNIRYNLSNADVGLFSGGNEPQNPKAVLFNEFAENNPNTVRQKKDFVNTNDTLLGDKKIPLSKIHNFYGVENGKFKVGNLNSFNNNTTIVPIRSNDVLFDSLSYNPNVKPEQRGITFDEMKRFRNDRSNLENRFSKEHPNSMTSKPNPTIIDKIIGSDKFVHKDSLEKYYPKEYNRLNEVNKKMLLSNDLPGTTAFEYFYKGNKLNQIPINKVVRSGKFILNSPETDNSTFYSLNNDAIRAKEIQEYLKKNKVARPILVDNGRYRNYVYDNKENPFGRYGSMDYMRDNQNVFYTK